MKKYEKPALVANDMLAEGVYAASGSVSTDTVGMDSSGDCWTVDVTKDQNDAGGYCTFRVAAAHSRSAEHISSKTVITILFSDVVTSAEFEGFEASVSGTTVTLTRKSHANGYKSGDNFNTLLKIWADNYRTIQASNASIVCTHEVNVQGGYD
jgi:hypothetical protein